jgi:nitroreductase
MDVSRAIETRKSCRDFSDRPVDEKVLRRLMELTCRAPSAINLQPWLFTVVMGQEVRRLSRKLHKAHAERGVGCAPDNVRPLPELYVERRKELGRGFVPLMQEAGVDPATFIDQGSLSFYNAPAVVVAALHRVFPEGRALDVGLAVGWLLLAAAELGLDTCPIGLICAYEDEIKDFLNIPEDYQVVLSVAVGYGKPDSPLNRFRSPRAPLEQVVRWY